LEYTIKDIPMLCTEIINLLLEKLNSKCYIDEKALELELNKLLTIFNKLICEKTGIKYDELLEYCLINTGAESPVCLYVSLETEHFYSRRVISRNEGNLKNILKEIMILLMITRDNYQKDNNFFLDIYYITLTKNDLIILMEYGKGDLAEFCRYLEEIKHDLSKEEKDYLLSQIQEQANTLRELKIYHRDIKPSNIIITEDWNLKYIDFGFAEYLGDNNEMGNFSICGTSRYCKLKLIHEYSDALKKNHLQIFFFLI
jgi:serine/threonine protein kinase